MSRLVVEDADICDFATAIVEFDGESGYAIVSIDADAAAPASPRGPTDTTQSHGAVEAARATHADTPGSVEERFADRVTPCSMPIGNGPSSTLESSYTTSSSCSTTTSQASRYGDRPRPTRQPSNKRMARDFRDPGGRRANSGGRHASGLASDGVR